VYIASVAIARYAELHAVAESSKHLAHPMMSHMAQHFTVKTGETLSFDLLDEDAELFQWIGRGISRLGKEALVALIKAKVGL
jgi:IS4 transposase